MRYELQFGRPEQFLHLNQLLAPFDGRLDMNPDSFGVREDGTKTVIAILPIANAPAFEKIIDIFGLNNACKKL